MQLTDKVAIITGASRGIGRAVALALAAQGAKIVASARNLEALNALVAELKEQGAQAIAVAGDVAITADADKLVAEAVAAFGRVDILINNAGITRDGLLMRMKDEDWDAVLDTNLKGAFHCLRAVSKVMSKQRYGRVINISSVVGEMGNPGQVNYCASKAGLLGLTKSAALELARRNITVNAITPGFIVTDMTEDLNDKAKAALTERIPLGRLGESEDISHAVQYLASDQASYVTGQILRINGGMYM
ncbi:MAG: 3-oxoacyl-[acyl-carrier-protein] reductase [Desulfuromonadales bacterium]|nr:3-oxoacyl-[acyl-carrier-protein] reductase [Desulfuromonadales bacterium]